MLNYIINPQGITCEHFPDETIILNLPKGNYYSLQGTGQLIWSQLENGISSEGILLVIVNRYDISAEAAQPVLQLFLNQLFQEELLQEIDSLETLTSPEILSDNLRSAFTEPVLEVYTDMQELLMLDPIHDSDPKKGWPHKNNA